MTFDSDLDIRCETKAVVADLSIFWQLKVCVMCSALLFALPSNYMHMHQSLITLYLLLIANNVVRELQN